MENKVQPTNRNLHEFIYEPGTKVELEGDLFSHIIALANKAIEENTDVYITDRYNFVNTETGKTVKNPKQTDIESGKVAKVTDLEGTFGAEPKYYRKPLALDFIKLVLMLNGEHLEAIKEGKAIHLSELQNRNAPQPESAS